MTSTAETNVIKHMIVKTSSSGTNERTQTKTIPKFLQFFKSRHCSNYMRAKRFWNDREEFMNAVQRGGTRNQNVPSISLVSGIRKKKIMTEPRVELGQKCCPWPMYVDSDLVKKFDRLQKLRVKIATTTLEAFGKALMKESATERYNADTRSG